VGGVGVVDVGWPSPIVCCHEMLWWECSGVESMGYRLTCPLASNMSNHSILIAMSDVRAKL
jgi:hypothetical protein